MLYFDKEIWHRKSQKTCCNWTSICYNRTSRSKSYVIPNVADLNQIRDIYVYTPNAHSAYFKGIVNLFGSERYSLERRKRWFLYILLKVGEIKCQSIHSTKEDLLYRQQEEDVAVLRNKRSLLLNRYLNIRANLNLFHRRSSSSVKQW